MTVSVFAYGPSTANIRKLGDNGIKAMLVSTSYTPNTNLHDFRSDVTSFEITSSGYVAGGVSLASPQWTYDQSNKWTTLTASNPSWTALPAANVRYVVIYANMGSADTDFLLSYVDLGQTVDLTSQGLTVVWPAGGIYRLRAPASS
jgi:hypothetical protein